MLEHLRRATYSVECEAMLPRQRVPVRTTFRILVLALVSTVLLGGCGHSVLNASQGATTTVNGPHWQTYRDPHGYYTLQLPPGWSPRTFETQGLVSDTSKGLSATYTIYNSTFGNPPHSSTAPIVSISYFLLSQPLTHSRACQLMPNASLGGIPAFRSGNNWVIVTDTAEYQIAYTWLNFLGGVQNPDNRPTEVPTEVVQADQHLYEQIVSTFQPRPATSPICK